MNHHAVIVIVGFSLFCYLEFRRRQKVDAAFWAEEYPEMAQGPRLPARYRNRRVKRHRRRREKDSPPLSSPILETIPPFTHTPSSQTHSDPRYSQSEPLVEKSPFTSHRTPRSQSTDRRSVRTSTISASGAPPGIEGFFPPRIPRPSCARIRD